MHIRYPITSLEGLGKSREANPVVVFKEILFIYVPGKKFIITHAAAQVSYEDGSFSAFGYCHAAVY